VKEKQGLQMMNCKEPEINDLFPFYLNGDVTPDETRKIESHVSGCAECQRKLSFFVTLSEHGLPAWRRADAAAFGPGRVQFHR
jgi:Putative zinc-finger